MQWTYILCAIKQNQLLFILKLALYTKQQQQNVKYKIINKYFFKFNNL